MNNKVEIHSAWFWTCHACGLDNFEYSVAYEPGSAALDELDNEELAALDDCGALKGGWYSYPDRVTCKSCHERYQAQHAGDCDDIDG